MPFPLNTGFLIGSSVTLILTIYHSAMEL